MNATSNGFSLKVMFKGRIFSQNHLKISILIVKHTILGGSEKLSSKENTPPQMPGFKGKACAPVSEGGDEVEATVHPVVDDVPSVQTALVMQVPLKLLVDVGDDCFKAETQILTVTAYKRQHP